MGYLIYQNYLVPSKIRGELPDVKYEFVANTSDIGYHFDFTKQRKNAFVFDDEVYSFEQVKEIADLLQMKVKELF